MFNRCNRYRLLAAFTLLAGPCLAVAQVPATWLGGDGSWEDPTRWSTNPFYPDFGTPIGTAYTATIPGTGSPTVQLSSGVGVASFSVDSGATLNLNGTGYIQTHSIPRIDGVLRINHGSEALRFVQGLTGNGTIAFASPTLGEQSAIYNPGNFTIGSGLSLSNAGGNGRVDTSNDLVNNGTLYVNNPAGAMLFRGGRIFNNGAIDVSAGTLFLGALSSLSDFDRLNVTGGRVYSVGTVTNGGVLDLDRFSDRLRFADGLLSNITLRSTLPVRFETVGTFGGVGLSNATMQCDVESSTALSIGGSLSLNNRMLRMTGENTELLISPTAFFPTGGTFIMAAGGLALGTSSPTQQFAIPPNILIQTQGIAGGTINGLNSFGTVAINSGGSVSLTGNWQNVNGGRLIVAAGGTLGLEGELSFARIGSLSNSGMLELRGPFDFGGQALQLGSGPLGNISARGRLGEIRNATLNGPGQVVFREGARLINSTISTATADLGGTLADPGRLWGTIHLSGGTILLEGTVNAGSNGLTSVQGLGAVSVAPGATINIVDDNGSQNPELRLGNGIEFSLHHTGGTPAAGTTSLLGATVTRPAALTTNGLFTHAVAGHTLHIRAATFENNGTVVIANGSTLSLQVNSLRGTGPIRLQESTLSIVNVVGASFLNRVAAESGTIVLRSGAAVAAGTTLSVKEGARWFVGGGSINGGAGSQVVIDNGAKFGVLPNSFLTFSNVGLTGEVLVPAGLVSIATETPTDAVFRLGESATTGTLSIYSAPPSLRNSRVLFSSDAAPSVLTQFTGTLTIDTNSIVRTDNGSGRIGLSGNSVINRGLIDANSPGRRIDVVGNDLFNFGRLNAAGGATLAMAATTRLVNTGTISVSDEAGSGGVLHAGSFENQSRLSIDRDGTAKFNHAFSNTGLIDIGGRLIIDYPTPAAASGAFNQLRPRLLAGYAGGAWTGPSINSSAAANEPGTGVGILRGSQLFADAPAGGPFGALTASERSVVFAWSLLGDTDLNGVVDIDDFGRLARSFEQPGQWFEGDADYNGLVDMDDFSWMAANFNRSVDSIALHSRAVPEPAVACLAIFAGALWTAQIRSRRRR